MNQTKAFFAVLCCGFAIGGALIKAEPSSQRPRPASAQAIVNTHELGIRWSCEDSLKGQLRNPRSYQATSVRMLPADPNASGVVVSTVIQFRAENGFGGMGPGTAVCGHDAAGHLVGRAHIVGQG